jgi:hypothetical protein
VDGAADRSSGSYPEEIVVTDKTPEEIAEEIISNGKAGKKRKTARVDRDKGATLLDDVYKFTGRFVAYPSEHAHVAHVLWIAHAHAMSAWESTPRIAFLSPEPASGKTRSLEVTELLVPNAVESVNCTPAYMFRKCGAEDGPPTILFDEIDTVFGAKAKENEELRALLNSGHRRGATCGRCVVRGQIVDTEEISSYAAVALAGLGWLPDTILSRSIIVRMRRRAADEIVESFRRRVHAPEGEALRQQLAGWTATIIDEATAARPPMPPGVEDRAADVWEPLLAIADIAGAGWPERARAAAVALVAVSREDVEPSLNMRLLADLRDIFGERDSITTKTILAELCQIEGAPWSDVRGKPLSDNQLARRLRQYGVKPRTIRTDHGTPRAYLRYDLVDVWRRYLPPFLVNAETLETPATSQQLQGDSVSAEAAAEPKQPPEPETKVSGVEGSDEDCCGSGDRRKPHNTDNVAGVLGVLGFPDDGPGLSRRAIDDLVSDVEDWVYGRRHNGDTSEAEIEAEVRRRLIDYGIFPEAVEIELKRVLQCLYEPRLVTSAIATD